MAKNKILTSDHYVEIHERLANGEKPDDVSKWLLKKYGEKISPRTMKRYFNNHIDVKTKVQASYNKRKAQQKKQAQIEEKVIESKVEDKLSVDNINDEYTESVVDALEIIDSWIPKVSDKINLNKMTEYQKAMFLCKMLDIKLKYTMGPSEEEEEFNILDVFKAEIKVIK